jgi:hypothetical protein
LLAQFSSPRCRRGAGGRGDVSGAVKSFTARPRTALLLAGLLPAASASDLQK